MSLHPAGRAAGRRYAVIAALIGVVVLVAVVLIGAVAVVANPDVVEADAAAQDADAVVALAGDPPHRFDVARELAETAGAPLVVSWVPGAEGDRDQHCEADPDACFTPEPATTEGEAREVGSLAEERGWQRVVVVTSGHHAARAGLLARQCVEGTVAVVDANPDSGASTLLQEAGAILSAVSANRAC